MTTKPLSTTTPEAIAAANQVTPERLSELLINKGPLAIRYITKELSRTIPCFIDLSASKQRRLIMSAMETGDIKNNRLFEKIGWGQWSIRVVPSKDFESQRKLINLQNNEVKLFHQSTPTHSRKRTLEDGSSTFTLKEKEPPMSPLKTNNNQNKNNIIYIEENVIHSDGEDDKVKNLNFITPTQKSVSLSPIAPHPQLNKIIKATVHYPRKRLHSFSTLERPSLFDIANKRRHSAIVYTNNQNRDEIIAKKLSTNNTTIANGDKSPRLSYILSQPVITTPMTSRKSSYSSTTNSVESSIRSTLAGDNTTITTFNNSFPPASPPLLPILPPMSNNKNDSVSPYSDTDDEDWSTLSPLNNKKQETSHLHLIDELTERVLSNDKLYTLTQNESTKDDSGSIPRSMNEVIKSEPLIKDQSKDHDVAYLLLNLRS
ncbi:hypothetical protein MOUN0_L06964 [Monosporozyma unispora]|nr:DNA-binding proteins Bright/BRCAA1/RBP1 and proteins containing BRIGHT domain [Kazachstania unispora]